MKRTHRHRGQATSDQYASAAGVERSRTDSADFIHSPHRCDFTRAHTRDETRRTDMDRRPQKGTLAWTDKTHVCTHHSERFRQL